MKVVIDTDILFSGLVNPSGIITNIIFNHSRVLEFYTPDATLEELNNHKSKLVTASKISQDEIDELLRIVLKHIKVIDYRAVSKQSKLHAAELIKDIDEFDVPFVALSLELGAHLWTGDKKLRKGLENKGFHSTVNSQALADIIFNPRIS